MLSVVAEGQESGPKGRAIFGVFPGGEPPPGSLQNPQSRIVGLCLCPGQGGEGGFQAGDILNVQGFLRWIDLFEQTAENLSWTHFNKQLRSRGNQRLHAVYPADRAGDLANEGVAGSIGGGDETTGDVGGYGDAGIGQRESREDARDLLLRGLHEGAVERRADGEHKGAPCAFGFDQGRDFFDGRESAGDDGLAGGVEVGGCHHEAGFGFGFAAGFGHLIRGK